MTSLIFALNDVLRRSRFIWVGPVFLFLITLGVRITPAFTKETYIIYLVNVCALTLNILISLSVIINLIRYLMPNSEDIKYEVLFYKALGLDIFSQFALKTFILILSLSFLFAIESILTWSIDFKYLVFGLALSLFFLVLRATSVIFSTSLAYYVGIILIIISLVYPLYILPNVAYVFKSQSPRIYFYLFTYVFLYFVAGFKLFQIAWRDECIGWIF